MLRVVIFAFEFSKKFHGKIFNLEIDLYLKNH